MSGAAQLGELGARLVQAGVDVDRAGRFLAERQGVPHEIIPTTKELQARDAQAQQAQQLQQLLASPAVAQVMGQVARGATDAAAASQAGPVP
jgi:hypothetical protein